MNMPIHLFPEDDHGDETEAGVISGIHANDVPCGIAVQPPASRQACTCTCAFTVG